MKKVLGFLVAAIVAVASFGMSTGYAVGDYTARTCGEGLKKIYIHHQHPSGDYTGFGVWTWSNGTGGSGDGLGKSGVDAFGAVTEICVGADADTTGWFIPISGNLPELSGNGWPGDQYKDGFNAENISYDRTALIEGDATELHVYFFSGDASAIVVPVKEGFGVSVVVYYDPTGEYDGWNIWTWGHGTGGSADGVDFTSSADLVSEGVVGTHQVAFIYTAADAVGETNLEKFGGADQAGFILRTDSWSKKYPDDLSFDISGVKGSGIQFVYYLAGEGEVRTDRDAYLAAAYAFELTSAIAPSNKTVLFQTNKDLVTLDSEGAIIFDYDSITVKDKDGNVIAIDEVRFDTAVTATKSFSLDLAEVLVAAKSPYTVEITYDNQTASLEIDADFVAPVFTVVGGVTRRVEIGSTTALPTITVTDNVDGNVRNRVFIESGEGTVDTRAVGTYTVTLRVVDTFGNEGSQVITYEVYDPCAETTQTQGWVVLALAPLPVAVLAFATRKFFI